MTGAVFVLAINLAIATVMAITFFVVGYLDTRNRAAIWFGIAFVLAVLSLAGELALHAGLADGALRIFIALAMLGCMLVMCHGLAQRYGVSVPAKGLAAGFLAASVLYGLILDMPRDSMLRQALYQVPYSLAALAGAAIVMRAQRRTRLDRVLAGLLVLTALSFAVKPIIAQAAGGMGETGRDYASTLYAAISMSSGGIAALLLAMACLALFASDTLAALIHKAEHDAATGLFNQNGFEQHGARRVASVPRNAAHELAVMLIALEPPGEPAAPDPPGPALAEVLRSVFGSDALIARISAMTFAVLLPQADLFAARRQADMLRARLAAGTVPPATPASASIGITEHEPGDSLSDMVIRAQWALEEARRAGGNTVRLAARSALAGHGRR